MSLNSNRRIPPADQSDLTATAAPSRFPYKEHRTLADVWRDERNAQIAERFKAGETQNALALAFNLSLDSIKLIVRKAGVPHDPARGGRQAAESKRQAWANPEYREQHIAKVRRANSAWHDCPPDKFEDYQTLRRYFGAHEARAILEGME